MRRLLRFLGGLNHAGLAGALVCLTVFAQQEGQSHVAHLLVGWLYGVGVLGLIRLFQVASWAYPIVGLLCGPAPLAVLTARQASAEDWGGAMAVTVLLGLVIGLLEAARRSHLSSSASES